MNFNPFLAAIFFPFPSIFTAENAENAEKEFRVKARRSPKKEDLVWE